MGDSMIFLFDFNFAINVCFQQSSSNFVFGNCKIVNCQIVK